MSGPAPELRTERLVMRGWRADDVDAMHAINSHPEVVAWLASTPTRAQTEEWIADKQSRLEQGVGPWAVETVDGGKLVGAVGLQVPVVELVFSPCVEVLWRIAPASQGRGYATEAARAALAHGFDTLALDEIVSFTARSNVASQRVMAKIGMVRDVDGDFPHPMLDAEHPLSMHVLYRISR